MRPQILHPVPANQTTSPPLVLRLENILRHLPTTSGTKLEKNVTFKNVFELKFVQPGFHCGST